MQTTNPKCELTFQRLFFHTDALNREFSWGLLQGQEQQRGAEPTSKNSREELSQTGNKRSLNTAFSLKKLLDQTAQCSPPALRGQLSEELGTACSDLGIKLHLNLQNSFTNSRFSSKGASDAGAKPSHGEKKDVLHLQQATLKLFPSESCQTQGAEVSFRSSLHDGQQFELGKWFGVLPSPFSCFKRMDLDCCSYKASSVPGSAFQGLRHRSSSCWSTAHSLSSFKFLKHSL